MTPNHRSRRRARRFRASRRRADRARLLDDVQDLELRLAIIDDRFERLAARPDDQYRGWRADLVGRIRTTATRAAGLDARGALEPPPSAAARRR